MGSACSVWTTGFAPSHDVCAFPIYTAQAPGCSAGELSKVGPCVLPRSKLLRFGFSSTPQRHKFSLACILCPSQVRGGQATRCLPSAAFQVAGAAESPPQSQLLCFLGAQWEQYCIEYSSTVSLFQAQDVWKQV